MAGGLVFYGFVVVALLKKVLGRIFKQLHFVCQFEVEVHEWKALKERVTVE
jgi:hypothetical protein